MYVAPILRDFLDVYPSVMANTLFVDRVVNIVEEGLDVAIRIGDLPDLSLTAIRVGFVRRVLFAAPSYFEKYGVPKHPRDLAQHRIIASEAAAPVITWRFYRAGGRDFGADHAADGCEQSRHSDRVRALRVGHGACPILPGRAPCCR